MSPIGSAHLPLSVPLIFYRSPIPYPETHPCSITAAVSGTSHANRISGTSPELTPPPRNATRRRGTGFYPKETFACNSRSWAQVTASDPRQAEMGGYPWLAQPQHQLHPGKMHGKKHKCSFALENTQGVTQISLWAHCFVAFCCCRFL